MLKPLKFIVHSKLSPAIFILLFAAAGLVYLRTSHATTPVASVQVEAGSRTTNAALVSDTTASAGSAVKFNAAASGGTGGGVCNNPFASTSVARGDINIGTNGLFQVRNEAWGGSHGPQTIYACNEQSWYVTSNQPDAGGAVQTYPDSLYSISGSKTVAQYTSITSTFAEEYQHQGNWNAAYDLWLNDWSIEVMIWNEWNGGPGYWATQAKTAVTLNGVPYHFYNNGGELMFFRDTQVKSGSVDILAAWQWLVTKNLVKTTDVPTQIEYGVEICSTVGTQRFDTTGFTVDLH
jgi:hypothetical protein